MARRRNKRRILSDRAIVLRVTLMGEGDGMVTLFSQEHGKVRGVVKRIQSVRSGFAGRFEVLSDIRLRYYAGRTVWSIQEARLEASAFEVCSRPRLQPFAYQIAELVEELMPERDPAPEVFRLMGKGVQALGAGVPPRLVARYVEYWMLRLSGHVPDERRCGSCGRDLAGLPSLALSRSGILCRECRDGEEVLQRLEGSVRDTIAVFRRRDVVKLGPGVVAEEALDQIALFNRTLLREVLGRDLRTHLFLRRYRLDTV